MSYFFELAVTLLKKSEIFIKIYDERECHVKFYWIDRDKIICKSIKDFDVIFF